jgi:transcriptional regulator with XRE-family HTH domain
VADDGTQDEKNLRAPHPIDVHVGQRMRTRRRSLGLTQVNLAQSLGLTFQQVQKYERGLNRISASRLYELSIALGVHVGYFFESFERATLGADTSSAPRPDAAGLGPLGLGAMFGDVAGDEASELIDFARAYLSIKSAQLRRQIYDLARTVADVTGH